MDELSSNQLQCWYHKFQYHERRLQSLSGRLEDDMTQTSVRLRLFRTLKMTGKGLSRFITDRTNYQRFTIEHRVFMYETEFQITLRQCDDLFRQIDSYLTTLQKALNKRNERL